MSSKYIIQNSPYIVPTNDGKLIEEHFGNLTDKNSKIKHFQTQTPTSPMQTSGGCEFLDLKSPGNKVWGPMRTVDVQRLPNTGLGISIVGGKVSLNFKSVKKAQDLNYALKFSPHIKQKGMY